MLYFGETIRTMRIRRGLTQEQVSSGICTTSTLSKIENGKSIASRWLMEALLERIWGGQYVQVLYESEQTILIKQQCEELLFLIETRKLKQANEKLDELEKCDLGQNILLKQSILLAKALYLSAKKEDPNRCEESIREALTLTFFREKEMLANEKDRMKETQTKRPMIFTKNELLLLNGIGICNYRRKQTQEAIALFEFLSRYLYSRREHCRDRGGFHAVVLTNLALCFEQNKQYSQALNVASSAITIASHSGRYSTLSYLLCIKGRCYKKNKKKKHSRKCFQQAKAFLEVVDDYKGYQNVEEFQRRRIPVYLCL